MTKKDCIGCRDNFYNGNNNLGVGECWSFKHAKLVWRVPIGLWERPPYLNKKKIRVPDCYHEEGSNKTVYVDPSSLTKEGYWRK